MGVGGFDEPESVPPSQNFVAAPLSIQIYLLTGGGEPCPSKAGPKGSNAVMPPKVPENGIKSTYFSK